MNHLARGMVLMVSLVAAPWVASAAEMPKEMWGRYILEGGSCQDMQKAYKATGMWDGMIVGKAGVSFIESSCEANRVSKGADGSQTVRFKCSGEGEEWDFTGGYKLSGDVLTVSTKEGPARYKRCGK